MTTFNRRKWLGLGLQTAAVAAAAAQWPMAFAQSSRPVSILVGFPPGGGSDALARLLAVHLQKEMGMNFVVDNRPGAGGQIAAQALKAAAPDGNTVFFSHDHTVTIVPKVVKVPGFNTEADFQAVAGVATFVNAFAVTASHPAKTFHEYVEWVKAQTSAPMRAIGVPAPASTLEFIAKVLDKKYDLDIETVPYRGSGPMLADLMGAQIQAGFATLPELIELNKSGRVRILNVLGSKRQAVLPDVPTFAEIGVAGFEDPPFYGFFAPKGMPAEKIAQWEQATQKVLQIPEVRKQLEDWGMTVDYMNHQQLHDAEAAYSKTWGRIINDLGYVPQ
ncbi:Twin-arginine translocation pathway signal [Lampropedia puyangensis]|uniref:Twin-arginine translocation pathway signal n=1 Tax=Lampropedia puyangensis TaxID=1330072 RepID=A0A4S8EZB2_9BURK|nr:tripartite tricarboxylate transporter substrate-binding protein [Lampropedia puyangensis]THU00283.1 Twin-arginine translocation pathway signal [Lampropedia puyangensis]